MKYQLTDYQGNIITSLPAEKAKKLADVAELIELEVAGQIHYINPKNIASIKPTTERETINKQLPQPDYRGKPSPAKEKLRKLYLKNKK